MKAVTIAAAGAALFGTVTATGGHIKHMHAHQNFHVRRNTSAPAVDPVTTPTVVWEDWSTTSVTTTPATSSTSAPWVEPASTNSTTPLVTTSSTTWAWPASETDTECTDEWSSVWTTEALPTTPATTTPAPWTPVPTPSTGWTWTEGPSSKPVGPDTTSTSTTVTWATTWATVSTVTVSPVPPSSATTWADWSSADTTTGTTTLSETITTTVYVESATQSSVSVSTLPIGWSSSGWFGPSWTVNPADVCTINVVTSYGAPTWHPTPEPIPEVTVTVTASPVPGWSSSSAVGPASGSSSAAWGVSSVTVSPVPQSSTSSWVAPAPAVPSSWAPAPAPAPASSWAASPASSWLPSASPSGSWGGGSSPFNPNGKSWAMTYSPYTNAGGCKDAGTVANDLKVIASKGFSSVRVYSTDCSTLQNVGNAARNNGLKLILGVFISSTGINGAQKQVTDITAWAQWDLVELIVIGNEAVFNGYCSAPQLAGFVASSAGAFKAAGYTGKVTLTEPLTIWESQGSAFCGVVDIVAANLYAFFNAQTTADKAGALIQAQIAILNGICPGKDAYIMESGWPHAGNCNGLACPSPENQATALKGIQSVVGAKVVFFSYEDEAWKDPGQFGVEQHWGCAGIW